MSPKKEKRGAGCGGGRRKKSEPSVGVTPLPL